ncbi:DUF1365 domain-containing protein [Curvivirga aplysinae]|uniref:DUF1365 domain-containing protein n=1 Tax=Curvivirga aplysinae TaxID=2529852 RepID=UPI0012BD0688|nr:DUF1365 family protein [Curvivirga aplysinae]MTI08894.1 DUF1365 domain-containing protein [Curvivirga aplysinae]
MGEWNSRLYHGRVLHVRFKPKKHLLRYRVCSFLFDLDELEKLSNKMWLFSFNKWNLLSFHNRDFGAGNNRDLRSYVVETLANANIEIGEGRVELLCYPRIFGYVFNPLSIYFCYDDNGQMSAIIYEVTNTFKQRHSYVIEVSKDQKDSIKQICEKKFYVSPFMEMDASYHFTIHPPKDTIAVLINQHDKLGPLLKAAFTGKAEKFSNFAIFKMILRYPLMTLKVVAGIHWEALHLWRKGVKLVERPNPPKDKMTHIAYGNQPQERFVND